MSYDIEIWAARTPDWDGFLADEAGWEQQGDSWIRPGRDWQVVVFREQRVEAEDIPTDVDQALPGIRFLLQIHLEPLGAPKSAYRVLHRTLKRLAKDSHGVILDPQTDEITLPSGVRRYQKVSTQEKLELLELSWFFTESPLLEHDGPGRLVDMLRVLWPEAMPRRYGEYEPPEHRLEETGIGHLVRFIEGNSGGTVVWYPQVPFAGVQMGFDRAWGWDRRGFRVNYLSLAVEAAALAQPGWLEQMRRGWRAFSSLVRPFFGDVRTLHGYERTGSKLWTTHGTEHHPVKAWWWRGVPDSLGHAAVLGDPYTRLWPRFVEAAEVDEGLAFLEGQWTGSADVADIIGGVPAELAQPAEEIGTDPATMLLPKPHRFAPVWPFETNPLEAER
jgi:hypothetical protein